MVNVQTTLPPVSAVDVASVGPLKVSATDSPARKPAPLTVSDAPGAACVGEKLNVAPLVLTVNDVEALLALARPVASTPYWPGANCGTVKLRLKLPPELTVGEPTSWPFMLTSTVSPGWKAPPLAVIEAPGRPDVDDRLSDGLGTLVAALVGDVVAPVVGVVATVGWSVGALV